MLSIKSLIMRVPCTINLFRREYVILQRRQWHPTPVLLPGKSHGRRSLIGCSPWSCWESDMTEWLHFHFSLSCSGEGNGKPLQYSCLENPREGGAWWAAVYGVAQSQTQLKRLSSSSSRLFLAYLSSNIKLPPRCYHHVYGHHYIPKFYLVYCNCSINSYSI